MATKARNCSFRVEASDSFPCIVPERFLGSIDERLEQQLTAKAKHQNTKPDLADYEPKSSSHYRNQRRGFSRRKKVREEESADGSSN